ncbi:Enterobactin synthase component D [Zhongshania aliphaticivorans]|uniref:Enterobactin synthase component D n=1 Tax=Zhongshania aliphaticivorans TaxID=1470434 RepID=A0A5S9NGR1_9GAMM|nr:Enterobactin synthase component D [Zhongshania aliphaticivorans]CAA0095324.1 Enterobactin synthase component D [Zhongshania aliphaticivorans]
MSALLQYESGFIAKSSLIHLPQFDGICSHCDFDTKQYSDSLFDAYNIDFPPLLQRATDVRKADFLAGRITAQHAFHALGLPKAPVPVGNHRSPVWPNTVFGSISHHKGSAYCLLMHRPAAAYGSAGIGIDAESIIDAADVHSLSASIARPAELDLVALNFDKEALALTVIFSAKESVFKVLYPAVARYFDFLDVDVCAIDINHNALSLRLLRDLSPQFLKGHIITVHWQLSAQTVLSWVGPS